MTLWRSLVLLLVMALPADGFPAATDRAAPADILPLAALASPLAPQAHPLAPAINRALASPAQPADWTPTGRTRRDYLTLIQGQVHALRLCQDASGRIIDPVRKVEAYFATPCYAHAVAALAAGGLSSDPALLESGMKSMDAAVADMARGAGNAGHGDFYTWPVMLAFRLYEKHAPAARLARWRAGLEQVNPRKLYRVTEGGNNWGVVNLAGEYLRTAAGLAPGLDYVESALAGQLRNFTDLGMYHEHGDPLAYDHFARLFLAGMLAQGYAGNSFERCRDLVWRGAWTSLLMISPTGEAPTGYRSSHHLWNEAEAAVTCEIYAAQYARAGRLAEAGAFKRAARLSLATIQRWIRPDGSGYIVKNRYPISAQHGYEAYSAHTCYNLLACSMLAQAWQFADEAVAERPMPAEAGGYVVPMLEPFHKIFAAAGGSFVEYDTRGDQVYNPTGLIRVQVKGGNPQLGPSNGCASKFGGASLAVGPAWQDEAGEWHVLAEQSPAAPPRVEVLEERPERARFRVSYEDLSGVGLRETVTVEAAGVTIEDEINADEVKAMRISFPMLVFDGQAHTSITLHGSALSLRLGGRNAAFQIVEPAGAPLQRTGKTLNHPNGLMEPVQAEFTDRRAVYRITAQGQ